MDFHRSLDSHVYLYGLRIEWYGVDDLDLWFRSDLEWCCVLVKCRRCRFKYVF